MPAVAKCSIVAVLLLTGSLKAQAQLLPVPGAKNPEWQLKKTVPADSPDASSVLSGADRMPNALQKSIASSGNHHYHWDGRRGLTYDWLSAPDKTAPRDTVKVRDTRNGIVYIYRRASRK